MRCLIAPLVISKEYLPTTLWLQFHFIGIHVKYVYMRISFALSSPIVRAGKKIKILKTREPFELMPDHRPCVFFKFEIYFPFHNPVKQVHTAS